MHATGTRWITRLAFLKLDITQVAEDSSQFAFAILTLKKPIEGFVNLITNIMDFAGSILGTKMKSEFNFQADLQIPVMPSCMYEQTINADILQNVQNSGTKLFTFHMTKENSALSACRRKLDFNQSCHTALYGTKPGQQITVARRNERERNRVKLINMTFATLRDHLPYEPETSKNKKMSKVDTLKAAIDYIKYLQELVDNHDAVNAVFTDACAIDTMRFDMRACSVESPEKSPARPEIGPETNFDALCTDEEDLLDFANWF